MNKLMNPSWTLPPGYFASELAHINLTEADYRFEGNEWNDTRGNDTISDSEPLNIVTWQKLALVVLFCSIIAGTVIGNTLVIAAVATTRRLRTVTNCFVMSLAVADWLVGMFVMPFKVVLFLCNNWPLGRIMCDLWISLDILLCTASILSLCAISIDRYLAITRPLAYSRKRRSKRLALSMISCVWVAAVVITSPPILGWYDYDSKREYECIYNDDRGYVIYSALGSFFIPLLVMLYVYAKIACVIAHRQKTIEKIQTTSEKRCCEDQDANNRDETHIRILEPNEEHDNRTERSSSSSGAHSINMTKLQVENAGPNFWSRFRTGSSSFRKSHPNSIKSERSRKDGSGRKKSRPSTLGKVLAGNNGRGANTGSRLCNHSITALSPQRSAKRSGKPSVNIISYSDGDLTTGCNYKGGGGTTERIWTVEGNDQCSRSNRMNGCARKCSDLCDLNTSLRTTGGDTNSSAMLELQSRVYPTYSPNPSPRLGGGVGLHQHHHRNSLQHYQGQSQNHHHHLHIYPQHQHPGNSLLRNAGGGSGSSIQIQSSQKRYSRSGAGLHVTLPAGTTTSDPNQNSAQYTSGRVASFKRETKTAQTLAAVVGGFIICWLPFFGAYVAHPFVPEGSIPDQLMDALIWLGWGNSAINPFIYAFYSPDFRSAFWRLTLHKVEWICRERKRDRSSPRRYDDIGTIRASA